MKWQAALVLSAVGILLLVMLVVACSRTIDPPSNEEIEGSLLGREIKYPLRTFKLEREGNLQILERLTDSQARTAKVTVMLKPFPDVRATLHLVLKRYDQGWAIDRLGSEDDKWEFVVPVKVHPESDALLDKMDQGDALRPPGWGTITFPVPEHGQKVEKRFLIPKSENPNPSPVERAFEIMVR